MKRVSTKITSRIYEICSSSAGIKSNDEKLIGKEKLLLPWKAYIGELFCVNKGRKPEMRKSMERPVKLKSEARIAMEKMKTNKARLRHRSAKSRR